MINYIVAMLFSYPWAKRSSAPIAFPKKTYVPLRPLSDDAIVFVKQTKGKPVKPHGTTQIAIANCNLIKLGIPIASSQLHRPPHLNRTR